MDPDRGGPNTYGSTTLVPVCIPSMYLKRLVQYVILRAITPQLII
jgi:hypothetical protein